MSIEHHLRASDEDRSRVIGALQQHAAVGRLSLDEYGERVDQVLRALTHGDLMAITLDLPGESAVEQIPAAHLNGARHLLIAFAVALLALAVIGGAVVAFR